MKQKKLKRNTMPHLQPIRPHSLKRSSSGTKNQAMGMDNNTSGLRRKQTMTSAGLKLTKSWLFLLVSLPVAFMVSVDDNAECSSSGLRTAWRIDWLLKISTSISGFPTSLNKSTTARAMMKKSRPRSASQLRIDLHINSFISTPKKTTKASSIDLSAPRVSINAWDIGCLVYRRKTSGSLTNLNQRYVAGDGIATPSQWGTVHKVIDVVLPVTPDRFLKAFILDDRFTHRIFQQAKDKDVHLGSWNKSGSSSGNTAGRSTRVTAMTRSIEYSHPVKTKFPGMPSHAKTYKRQEYAYNPKQGTLELEEHLRFEGIPKGDHFEVQTAWSVQSLGRKRAGQQTSSNVTISLRVNFLKKTILRKTIESQTLVEQGESLQNWIAAARNTLTSQASTGNSGTSGFSSPGEGISLDSCPSEGIRSFLSRKLGGLFQKMRIRESDDQPAAVVQ